jgi:chloramphenicol 3-O phosphotransferase
LDRTARIILLNGVGSAGKTSIAKALQTITAEPFLYVAMDAFLEMLPEASWGRPDGITFETAQQDGKPSVVIHTGPVAERTLHGMRRAVAAMARAGSDIIVDDVMIGNVCELARRLRALHRRRVRAAGRAGGARTRARRPHDRPRTLAI